MSKTVFVVLICFLSFQSFSQNKKEIDSINSLDQQYIRDNLQSSQQLFIQNLKNAQKINYQKGILAAHTNLGLSYALTGDYDKCVSHYLKVSKMLEAQKNYPELARVYSEIGFRIKYIDEEKGLYYFRLALSLGKKYKIGKELSQIYDNYGVLLQKAKPDSALYYYKQSLRLKMADKDSVGIPYSLNKIAVEMARRRDFKEAFRNMDLSDSYRKKNGSDFEISDNLAYRGDIFYEIPQADSAIFYYEKSLLIARKIKYNALERFCVQRLAELYKKQHKFEKALIYFQEFKVLEDSVLNGSVKNELAALQVEYETEKTQRLLAQESERAARIEKQNSQNQLILESRKKWLFFVIALSLGLAAVAIWVYRFQKIKRRNEKREYELNKQLETVVLEKGFAEEKIRIARELHDNIGSHLTFMISSLDNLSYEKNPDSRLEKIGDLSNFGRLTMKDLRDTIWAMNHDGGTVEQLITRISELRGVLPDNLNVSIQNSIDVNQEVNGLQLLNCFRIVQEFIQNAIKYSFADLITISLQNSGNGFLLKIADNGKGFEISKVSFGNGILNMQRRCEDLGGTFEIDSDASGTRISCSIPWKMDEGGVRKNEE